MTEKELTEIVVRTDERLKNISGQLGAMSLNIAKLDGQLSRYVEAADCRHNECREEMIAGNRNNRAAISELRFRLLYYLSVPSGIGAIAALIYAIARLKTAL